jgi:hypothetical protein
VALIGGFVSMNIAGFYAVMAVGYPQSCRAAAIGFHLTVARVGVITMVFFGGYLMNLGQGSFVYLFRHDGGDLAADVRRGGAGRPAHRALRPRPPPRPERSPRGPARG